MLFTSKSLPLSPSKINPNLWRFLWPCFVMSCRIVNKYSKEIMHFAQIDSLYCFLISWDIEMQMKILCLTCSSSRLKVQFTKWLRIGTKYFQSKITLSTCFQKINWVFTGAWGRKRIIRIWKSNLPNGLNSFTDITFAFTEHSGDTIFGSQFSFKI